jgi:glycosyltransferase involved in cell wall biosynthesis
MTTTTERSSAPLTIGATARTADFAAAALGSAAERIKLIPLDTRFSVSWIRAARRADLDIAAVRSEESHALGKARALRACGIAVWWLGPKPRGWAGSGAPMVASERVDVDQLDAVATAAARPGAGRAETGPDVTVLITTLNEGNGLDRIVGALVEQLGTSDELIVIDGGSTDGSVERVCASFAAESRLRIEVHDGAGISAGRNIGVQTAANDVVICTDAGCDPSPGWVEGMRHAFTGNAIPGLVSGTYHVSARTPLEQAQALACYPDPHEVRRPDLPARIYTTVFGLGFDPRFCVGRCVGFTRKAWADAGGFPEHLATGEDVSFGLEVARTHSAVGTTDADVTWQQRDTLGATWRMYRNYGIASSNGGNMRLLVRDGMRGVAYLGVLPLLFSARSRRWLLTGGSLYLSLPVRRALRAHATPAVYALLPVAMGVKDLGKMWGAIVGARRSWVRS